MTHFEKIFKDATPESIAEFLDCNGMWDNSPWLNWWDKQYCSKCDTVELTNCQAKELLGIESPFEGVNLVGSFCEVYKKCRYTDDHEPTSKEIIEAWLNSQCE